jgi:hypothetical protein
MCLAGLHKRRRPFLIATVFVFSGTPHHVQYIAISAFFTFALAADGSRAAAYVAPNCVATSTAADGIVVATPTDVATAVAVTIIVDSAVVLDSSVLAHDEAPAGALTSECQPNFPPLEG